MLVAASETSSLLNNNKLAMAIAAINVTNELVNFFMIF